MPFKEKKPSVTTDDGSSVTGEAASRSGDNDSPNDARWMWRDIPVELLGVLFPGVIFVLVAIVVLIAPAWKLVYTVEKESADTPVADQIKEVFAANQGVMIGGLILLAYVWGHVFFRQDPKDVDVHSVVRTSRTGEKRSQASIQKFRSFYPSASSPYEWSIFFKPSSLLFLGLCSLVAVLAWNVDQSESGHLAQTGAILSAVAAAVFGFRASEFCVAILYRLRWLLGMLARRTYTAKGASQTPEGPPAPLDAAADGAQFQSAPESRSPQSSLDDLKIENEAQAGKDTPANPMAEKIEYPYTHLFEYLTYRGLHHLAAIVPWKGKEGDTPPLRTKFFINALKIHLSFHVPGKCGQIVRNEGHIRLMSSVWYAARALAGVTVLGLVLVAARLWYVSYPQHTGFRTALAFGACFLMSCFFRSGAGRDALDHAGWLHKRRFAEAFEWICIPSMIGFLCVRAAPVSKDCVHEAAIQVTFLAGVWLTTRWLRVSIERSLHYMRVREILYVLETAWYADHGAGKVLVPKVEKHSDVPELIQSP
ncbi:MAG TPA: hypothetical protein VG796_20195 [Verrucomicrobiales bacterium]|jgi:hypothetical protein|nr:hypothetical protein [Verrucomicrobiales bacterium]